MQDRITMLFARSETAFKEGRLAAARIGLTEVIRATGDHPDVLHLLALTEQRDGRLDHADRMFRRALRVSPENPHLNNNYAILLEDAGDMAGACSLYDRALHHHGDFVDARINRALLHERAGRLALAKADAERAVALAPANATARTVLGSILRALGALDEAAEAFDEALAVQPARARALHGRARVALERGEPQAAALYSRVPGVAGEDRDALLGWASALEAEGDPRGATMLATTLAAQPEWLEGHRELVRMRCEAGDRESSVEVFERALTARPRDTALHVAYWQTLAQLGRYADVLKSIADTRQRIAPNDTIALVEAACTDESGDRIKASQLFAQLATTNQAAAIPRARHLLRSGDVDHAATLLEVQVRTNPYDIAAWAYLDLAWRLIDDARHEWLSGQQGLVGVALIGLDPAELANLAATLRDIHRTRAHPVEQSLRGGTQTRGALFARTDPTLRHVRAMLTDAIDAHVRDLPGADPTHPLLRYRDQRMAISGSWSVRLDGGGFHISHIHPQGLLSSALYVSVPDTLDHVNQAGWLELGVPPAELGIALTPLKTVAPTAGKLALFPSYFFHGTRPFGEGERLTIAFDVALA